MGLTETNTSIKREAPSTGDYVKAYLDDDGSYVQPVVLVDQNGNLLVTASAVPVSGTVAISGGSASAVLQAIYENFRELDFATEGEEANLRISLNRNLFTEIRDSEGNERGLRVNEDGNITVTLAPEARVKLAENRAAIIGRVLVEGIGENHYFPSKFSTPGMLSLDDKNRLETTNKAEMAKVFNVSISASVVLLANPNGNRAGMTVYNDHDTTQVYIKMGVAAASSSFSYKLEPRETWQMPFPIYLGVITVIGTAAAGTLRVTEYY